MMHGPVEDHTDPRWAAIYLRALRSVSGRRIISPCTTYELNWPIAGSAINWPEDTISIWVDVTSTILKTPILAPQFAPLAVGVKLIVIVPIPSGSTEYVPVILRLHKIWLLCGVT